MSDDDKSKNNSDNSDQPDLTAMATEYMNMWQEQLAGTASNETMTNVMAQTLELMNSGAAAMGANQTSPTKDTSDETNTGTQTVSDALGTANAVILKLIERIELLEKRVSSLESKS